MCGGVGEWGPGAGCAAQPVKGGGARFRILPVTPLRHHCLIIHPGYTVSGYFSNIVGTEPSKTLNLRSPQCRIKSFRSSPAAAACAVEHCRFALLKHKGSR